jgi:phospholipase/carboxylesterase
VIDDNAHSLPNSPDGSSPCEGDAASSAGDATVWIAPHGQASAALLLLHGLDMTPAQLAPLLRSLKLPAWIALPAGPVCRAGGQRGWWPVDDAARRARLDNGPADLFDTYPTQREAARSAVHAVEQELRQRAPGVPLVVAGFSQGAMLALDCALQSPTLEIDALALWSASRLAFREWSPALHRLRGVPVHLVHGRGDANLSPAAGLALRDALLHAGAVVRWTSFDGGHEIPLQAWVGLRRMVRELVGAG